MKEGLEMNKLNEKDKKELEAARYKAWLAIDEYCEIIKSHEIFKAIDTAKLKTSLSIIEYYTAWIQDPSIDEEIAKATANLDINEIKRILSPLSIVK